MSVDIADNTHQIEEGQQAIEHWRLADGHDHRSGFIMLSIEPAIPLILPAADALETMNLGTIFPEETCRVKKSLKDDKSILTLEVDSDSDNHSTAKYQYDSKTGKLTFENHDPDVDNDDYDPELDNIKCVQTLRQLIELWGLPQLDNTTIGKLNTHIHESVRKFNQGFEKSKLTKVNHEQEWTEKRQKAQEIYQAILLPLAKEANPLLFEIVPNLQVFTNQDNTNRIRENSQENVVHQIMKVINHHPDFFSIDSNIGALKSYIAKAALAHNWFPNDKPPEMDDTRDLKSTFGIEQSVRPLSAIIVDPDSEKFRKVGSGWHVERPTYVFGFDEIGTKALAFECDVMQASGLMSFRDEGDQQPYLDHSLTLVDAVVLQAITDILWEQNEQERMLQISNLDYNEVVVFTEIDWSTRVPAKREV